MATFIFSNVIILYTWWLRLYHMQYSDFYMVIEYLALRGIQTLWDIIMIWIPDDVHQLHEIFQELCPRAECVMHWLYNALAYQYGILLHKTVHKSPSPLRSDDIITSVINEKRLFWKIHQ